MRKRALAAGLALVVWPVLKSLAQNSGTTALVLRVPPESRIDPSQIALSFFVSPDGRADVITAPAQIVARVRALSGQTIRITAVLPELQGPSGPLPAAAVSWNGAVAGATGSARQATCASGAFASGAQDLVVGWHTSGELTCSLNFQLAHPRTLPPGAYSGIVTLAIAAQ